jgi:CubicO group peptidase (beta-lactamase class C family)
MRHALLSLVLFACTVRPTDAGLTGTGATGGAAGAGGGGTAGQGGSEICAHGPAAFETLVSELEAELAAQGIPGAGIAVVCDSRRIFARGVGVTRTGGEPVDEHTRFQLASMTKTFTATVATELDARGVVDLGAPIGAHVPFIDAQSPYARPFTLAELLAHTSGFTQYIQSSIALPLWDYFQAGAQHQPLWSPPGAVHMYNNLAYSLAGLTLERASGQPFADLVESVLFEPAGMSKSRMRAAVVESEGHFAWGHSQSSAPLAPTSGYLATEYYGPMGGAWSTAADLGRFAELLLADGDGVVAPQAIAEMKTPRTPTGSGDGEMGLGLFIHHYGEHTSYEHSGSVQGFTTDLEIVPSLGFAIALIVNADWHFPYLTPRAVELFAGVELPPPNYDPPQPSDHAEQAGGYPSVTLGDVQVTSTGSGLTVTIPSEGLTNATLTPLWRDNYSLYLPSWQYEALVTFWRVNGQVKFFLMDFGVGEKAGS